MLKIFALCLIFALTIHAAKDEKPNIIAYKNFISEYAVLNKDLHLSICLFNVGPGTAYDIYVSDNTFNHTAFELVNGTSSFKLESLASGASVNHTFTVKPTTTGIQQDFPAVVNFRDSPGGPTLISQSNNFGYFSVYSRDVSAKRGTPKEWAVYVGLATLVTLPFYLSWNSARSQAATAFREKKK